MGPTASIPPDLAPGIIVGGKYELKRKLGRGAMGEVWAARHMTIGQEVAVKLVMRETDNGDGTSAESRFLLEARVAASLSKKTRHIVTVTDHGQDGALGYLVMELLEGEPLDVSLERTGPRELAQVAPLVVQIARGLAIAHADGVTHRDLKPSNIFVTKDEEGGDLAKVLDFGIAKLRRGGDRAAAFRTQRGFLLGTPAYMSPEQARGAAVDHRADVWALAVIAYHLLTNEFPFVADTPEELFARIIRVRPIPVREWRPELPQVVEDFFARAFAKRLQDRFQSAVALANAFAQLEPLARGDKELPAPAIVITEPELMIAASMPRPSKDRDACEEDRMEEGSSIVAAGVPRRRPYVRGLVGGLLVGIVLAMTFATLGVYYQREPQLARRVVTPTVAVEPAIPLPKPLATTETTETTEAETETETPVTASVPVAAHRAMQPHAAPAAEAAEETPARRPRMAADKGEIF